MSSAITLFRFYFQLNRIFSVDRLLAAPLMSMPLSSHVFGWLRWQEQKWSTLSSNDCTLNTQTEVSPLPYHISLTRLWQYFKRQDTHNGTVRHIKVCRMSPAVHLANVALVFAWSVGKGRVFPFGAKCQTSFAGVIQSLKVLSCALGLQFGAHAVTRTHTRSHTERDVIYILWYIGHGYGYRLHILLYDQCVTWDLSKFLHNHHYLIITPVPHLYRIPLVRNKTLVCSSFFFKPSLVLLPPKSFPQKTLPYSFFRFYLPEHCDLSCHVKCTLAIESQQCLNPQVIFKADKEDFLSSIENIYLQENASKGRTCGQYTS